VSTERVESLIDRLSSELEPVKPSLNPLLITFPWLALSVLYFITAVSFIGIRFNLAEKVSDLNFLFEIGLMLGLSVSAAIGSAFLTIPDMRGKKWILAIPLVLVSVFLFWIAVQLYIEGASNFKYFHLHPCIKEGLSLVVLPVFALVLLTRKGATTRPNVMSFMNTLAVGSLGWVALRFTCANDTIGHLFMFHFTPFVIVGVLLAMLARRLYRW
jgi:hypothetical protein